MPPVTREVRAANARVRINSEFNAKQQAFLDFVLAHYVSVVVEKLDQKSSHLFSSSLAQLPQLIADAVADLGRPDEINRVFTSFQKYLYKEAA